MARLVCIGMTLALLLLLPGCSGCRQAPPKDKTAEEVEKERLELEKRDRERAKPDFETKLLVSRPPVGPVGNCRYKPGHWTCVALEEAKANHFDFVGELELAVTDNNGQPLSLRASPFELTVVRDMALAKGQAKSLETLLFVPPGNPSVWAACRLNAARAGRRAFETAQPLAGHMPSYQYYLVVLADAPELYGYLQGLHSIKPPGDLDNRGALLSRSDARRPTVVVAKSRQPVDEYSLRVVGRRLADGLGARPAAGDVGLAALGRAVDP